MLADVDYLFMYEETLRAVMSAKLPRHAPPDVSAFTPYH